MEFEHTQNLTGSQSLVLGGVFGCFYFGLAWGSRSLRSASSRRRPSGGLHLVSLADGLVEELKRRSPRYKSTMSAKLRLQTTRIPHEPL